MKRAQQVFPHGEADLKHNKEGPIGYKSKDYDNDHGTATSFATPDARTPSTPPGTIAAGTGRTPPLYATWLGLSGRGARAATGLGSSPNPGRRPEL